MEYYYIAEALCQLCDGGALLKLSLLNDRGDLGTKKKKKRIKRNKE